MHPDEIKQVRPKPTGSRKARGAKTQALVAAYFQDHGFPYCTDAGAGRTGNDLLNTPGLAVEVKGRAGFQPVVALRQAAAGGTGIPLAVLRMNGQGPACIDEWVAVMRLGDLMELLRKAGYGDGNTHPGVGSGSSDPSQG